ncbi:Cytochrome P450 [Amycolatopsis xylanica]|uniref:Cytochrome P450 n=1 Tax=Amycolatopsis xylanica TaxID=589385 RepID=A0A1H3QDX1_9PSEU|nr:cytochrome P450 [Amycolatopsis xylanica]SDZ11321.1 Cytochrome P450 [Amycolatopsis xylanica]
MQDPHAALALMREEGPVRQVVTPRGLTVWLVTRYADVRSLMSDSRVGKDAKLAQELFARSLSGTGVADATVHGLNAHMLNSDPPDHTRLRKLVNKAFTSGVVSRLRPRIEQITDELLDGMSGEVDLMKALAFPLPITVISELLGVELEDRDQFGAWSNVLVSQSDSEKISEAAGAMANFLVQLIERKRENPTDDLMSALVHASDEGDSLGPFELIAMAFLLMVAGYETTVNLIGNSVLALLRHPDQLKAVRADPSLVPNMVEEVLRFDGSINIATLRFAKEPIEVSGVEIPAGEFLFLSLLSANRDAERFPDPDAFDITRQTNGHLAFGHGIHYCVGAPLARLEGEIAIGKLLQRFDGIELLGEVESLRFRESLLVHGVESLPVRLS